MKVNVFSSHITPGLMIILAQHSLHNKCAKARFRLVLFLFPPLVVVYASFPSFLLLSFFPTSSILCFSSSLIDAQSHAQSPNLFSHSLAIVIRFSKLCFLTLAFLSSCILHILCSCHCGFFSIPSVHF